MALENEETASAGRSGTIKLILRLLPVALFGGLAIVFAISLFSGDASVLPSVLIDKPIPQFKLTGMGKDTESGLDLPGLTTKDLIKGDVTVVNFWASWCPPCRAEHPVLMKLKELNKAQIYGISQKDDPVKSLQFLRTLGNPYTAVGVDSNGRVAIDWGVYGLPETFVVDGEGKIRFKFVGPMSYKILAEKLLPEIEKAKRPISR